MSAVMTSRLVRLRVRAVVVMLRHAGRRSWRRRGWWREGTSRRGEGEGAPATAHVEDGLAVGDAGAVDVEIEHVDFWCRRGRRRWT